MLAPMLRSHTVRRGEFLSPHAYKQLWKCPSSATPVSAGKEPSNTSQAKQPTEIKDPVFSKSPFLLYGKAISAFVLHKLNVNNDWDS